LNDVHAATADPQAVLKYVPVDENIAMKMADIPRKDVPDLPDRVIAATGLFYAVPVLSRDGQIRSSIVRTIW
jgi:PIN domain nuclease of toxin-antitoxin system